MMMMMILYDLVYTSNVYGICSTAGAPTCWHRWLQAVKPGWREEPTPGLCGRDRQMTFLCNFGLN